MLAHVKLDFECGCYLFLTLALIVVVLLYAIFTEFVRSFPGPEQMGVEYLVSHKLLDGMADPFSSRGQDCPVELSISTTLRLLARMTSRHTIFLA